MSSCERFKNSILDFIDHELDILKKKELKSHIEACHDCECLMNQVRALRSQLHSLPRIAASEDFNVILRDCIRKEMSGKRQPFSWVILTSHRWIPATGFAVAVLVGGFFVLDQKTSIFNGRQNTAQVIPASRPMDPVPFNGQVQYVIDEYPNRVSLSRDDARRPSTLSRDSVVVETPRRSFKSRMTTVSF